MARIALLALSVSCDLVSSSARVTSVKSNQTSLTRSVTDGQPDPTIGPKVYLGPIKIIEKEGNQQKLQKYIIGVNMCKEKRKSQGAPSPILTLTNTDAGAPEGMTL